MTKQLIRSGTQQFPPSMGNQRPIDVELYARRLAKDFDGRKLLKFLAKQRDPCDMTQISRLVEGDQEKIPSSTYKLVRQLEKGELVRVRWDGERNWVEITERARRLIKPV